MKWLFRLFLCSILTSILVVSISGQEPRTESIAWPYFRDTLNPLSYTDPIDILHLICDTLVGYNPDVGAQPVPLLAEGWEVSEDSLTYTFHLRQDVLFHDDTPLTAGDVAYSFTQLGNEAIADIQEIDDFTINFILTTPTPAFLGRLAGYPIVSQEAAESGVDLTTNPVCAGPYKVNFWASNERLELIAHDNWYGTAVFGALPYDSLVIHIMPDPEIRRQAFENAEIDAALIPFEEIPNLANYPDGQLEVTDDYLTKVLVYNLNDVATGDVRVRQALSMAIDREQLATIFQGNLAPAQGFYPPYLLNSETGFQYNPDRANELLDEAGFVDIDGDGWRNLPDGSPLEVQLLVDEQPLQTSLFVAEILNEQFATIGVSVAINPVSPSDFFRVLSDCQTQVALLTAGTPYVDFDGGIRNLFNFLQNCGYLSDPTSQITGLLDQASFLPFGSAEQLELYRAVDQLAVNDATVLTPLFYGGLGLYLQPGLPPPEGSAWWCRFCPWC